MQESFVLSAALRHKFCVHHREGSCSSQYGFRLLSHRYGGVPVKMFADAPKLVHVVVATLDYRVDVRDKVEI